MKLLVLLGTISVALALPQNLIKRDDEKFAQILRNDFGIIDGANYRAAYETENNISEQKEGTTGSKGQSNVSGSYRYEAPDGQIIEVHYIADELGYRAESNVIPTPHPLPPHAVDLIKLGDELRESRVSLN